MKDELILKHYLLSDALAKIEYLIGCGDSQNTLEPNNELDSIKKKLIEAKDLIEAALADLSQQIKGK